MSYDLIGSMKERLIRLAAKVIGTYTEDEFTTVPRNRIVLFSRNGGWVPVDGRECFTVRELGGFFRQGVPSVKKT